MPENYRPVSLTCICSKIMDHILVSNIVPHFKSQHILSVFQHGFRWFHTCGTQLIGFMNDVARDMESGGQTNLIVMDFSKALDKVSHKELLSNYGIDKFTLRWIQDFISNRQQCVVQEGWNQYTSMLPWGPTGVRFGPNSIFGLHKRFTKLYELQSLEMSEKDWKMEFNIAKCNVLRITRRLVPIVFNYTLHGC